MLRQKYLPIFIFIWTNYLCKCQDLETFVAPIVDNKGAPLVAIVNTANISLHIVRSIEMPLREIINSSIECRINERLKEDIVSSKVLRNVNNKFDALQQKMDEYIGGNQITEVNQNIATLRKEMEELKNLAKTVSSENKDIAEKLEGLISTVNSRVALSACATSSTTISPPTTIKFQNIITSEGITNQHLTSFISSGVFMCEVPGLYHISVVITSNTNFASVKISKNNIVLLRGNIDNYYTRHGDYSHSNAAIVVTNLQKGDSIDIKSGNKDMKIIGQNYSCLTIVKVK